MEGGPAGCPQVFVVDSQAPVTLMPSVVKRDFRKKKQYLLYLLVGLALLGVIIEAGFIYHLYKPPVAAQIPSPEKMIGHMKSPESNEIHPVQDKKLDYNKPAAFVQGGLRKNVDENGVMQWQTEGLGSFLHQVGYEDGRLLIQTEGFYYIHSKVYFSDSCSTFRHQVMWKTTRYREDTKLMQALRYSCVEGEPSGEKSADVGNSFLGGVFRLYKSDSVYVKVNESSLVRAGVQDNFFGIFMI
uniref:Tumor necrosis factor ligand superfamily member 14-like n=1 Tax=Astyanax mexicanus TaxID=7994 RepID=A0A3B1IZK4_ASTMX